MARLGSIFLNNQKVYINGYWMNSGNDDDDDNDDNDDNNDYFRLAFTKVFVRG